MYQKIKAKFKANPTIFYACSIVASWAGVGSLMNFRTIALRYGAVPAIIWAVFNSLACITFGLFADRVPSIRRIMQSKVMFYFIGLLTLFQTWTQMSGMQHYKAIVYTESAGEHNHQYIHPSPYNLEIKTTMDGSRQIWDEEEKVIGADNSTNHQHKSHVVWWLPAIDDTVVCLYLPCFNADGFVLGGIYMDTATFYMVKYDRGH